MQNRPPRQDSFGWPWRLGYAPLRRRDRAGVGNFLPSLQNLWLLRTILTKLGRGMATGLVGLHARLGVAAQQFWVFRGRAVVFAAPGPVNFYRVTSKGLSYVCH